MFQFLIGSLVTKEEKDKQRQYYLFQFLIGSLVTIFLVLDYVFVGIVSIPYR